MIAIFIAAGLGSRLAPLTDECPKCMLRLGDKPILRRNIDLLRRFDAEQVYVITGHQAEKINFPDVTTLHNKDYSNNNILFSLMHARQAFEQAITHQQPLLISYSDIIYDHVAVKTLIEQEGDIVLTADKSWKKIYVGRTEHPESEAEKIIIEQQRITRLGKGLCAERGEQQELEFIGLLKLSPAACDLWLTHFDALNKSLQPDSPFMGAEEFCKSYLTHFMQHLIDNGESIEAAIIDGGWMEFDTPQDYKNLQHNYKTLLSE
ncbi:MAG: phosphocholine cytidylyltransferase family protein [Agarilytica sp.]